MPDRRRFGKVVDPADETLPLAVLAGADGFTEIAGFGAKKIDLLRRLLLFVDGAPVHNTVSE